MISELHTKGQSYKKPRIMRFFIFMKLISRVLV